MKCNACDVCCDVEKMGCNGELVEDNEMCVATHGDNKSKSKMTNEEVIKAMSPALFVSLAAYAGALESSHEIEFSDEDELFESVMIAARYFLEYEEKSGELFDTWKVFEEGLKAR